MSIIFPHQRLVETSPVETAGYDSLSLLAEQVSHHPPGVCEYLYTIIVFLLKIRYA